MASVHDRYSFSPEAAAKLNRRPADSPFAKARAINAQAGKILRGDITTETAAIATRMDAIRGGLSKLIRSAGTDERAEIIKATLADLSRQFSDLAATPPRTEQLRQQLAQYRTVIDDILAGIGVRP